MNIVQNVEAKLNQVEEQFFDLEHAAGQQDKKILEKLDPLLND